MDERIRSIPLVATDAARAARRSMRQIARAAVPALADFALVFVVTGRSIVGIASAHCSPAGERVLRTLQRVYRVRLDDLHSTVAQVVRTGRPSLRTSIFQEDAPEGARGSVADLHRRLACRSALVLPIHVGDTVTGAVSLCYAGSGRCYARADLERARRLARHFAQTIPPPLPHADQRLRAATGHARGHTAVRRRVASRN